MSVDPDALARANLLYRDPALYDAMFTGDTNHADLVTDFVDAHAPTGRTLIDFGCGTARDLDTLTRRPDRALTGVGVEVQPHLVDYARTARPHLDVRIGDLCSVRLGITADVLTCLGNVLAYLPDDHALDAAIATFAAHAHPGTLLIISTMTTPPRSHRTDAAVTVHGAPAHITIDTAHDPVTGFATTRRAWTVNDREHAVDELRRRVIPTTEIHHRLGEAGFAPIPVAPARQANGVVAARFTATG